MKHSSYSTWLDIDLNAIQRNVSLLNELSRKPVMAVVKANAYGHGSVPVARAALRAGAAWLGVARLEEALELREARIKAPILVMGFTPSERVSDAISQGVSITVWDHAQVDFAVRAARESGRQLKVHLKVDTGMSRLGVASEDAVSLAVVIKEHQELEFEGIFTHYARADEVDQSSAIEQEGNFRQVLDTLAHKGIQPRLIHAANSAASLFMPESRFDLIRPGIAIYGLHPSSERPLPDGFQPALTWKAVLSQVKTLPPGRGVSYGHEYITQGVERIGTLPVGYADGFRRVSGNQVLVGGVRVPVVGRVCMDQVSLQLDGVPEAKAGDEVVLIGSQDGASISSEQVAARWGTINYEVVCGLTARVPRLYIQ